MLSHTPTAGRPDRQQRFESVEAYPRPPHAPTNDRSPTPRLAGTVTLRVRGATRHGLARALTEVSQWLRR